VRALARTGAQPHQSPKKHVRRYSVRITVGAALKNMKHRKKITSAASPDRRTCFRVTAGSGGVLIRRRIPQRRIKRLANEKWDKSRTFVGQKPGVPAKLPGAFFNHFAVDRFLIREPKPHRFRTNFRGPEILLRYYNNFPGSEPTTPMNPATP
jgi:hypothetical protein